MQDIKTLRELYYKQKQRIEQLEYESIINQNYKKRYEIKCRTCDKYKELYRKAIGFYK